MNRLKLFLNLIYGMSDVAVCRLTFRLRLRPVGGGSSGFTLLSDSANVSVPCECFCPCVSEYLFHNSTCSGVSTAYLEYKEAN